MAEGDKEFYNSYKKERDSGAFAWGSAGIAVTLHTGYTPNIDTHTAWSDVSATEYGTAGGYTANGVTISGATKTQDNTNDRALFDCDNIDYGVLTLSPDTPSHAILRETLLDLLIGYIELGATATNGTPYILAVSNSPAALFYEA